MRGEYNYAKRKHRITMECMIAFIQSCLSILFCHTISSFQTGVISLVAGLMGPIMGCLLLFNDAAHRWSNAFTYCKIFIVRGLLLCGQYGVCAVPVFAF